MSGRRKGRTKQERRNRVTRAESKARLRDASTAFALGIGALFLLLSLAFSEHKPESLALAAIIVSGFLASPALLGHSGIFSLMLRVIPWFGKMDLDRANRWVDRADRRGTPNFKSHFLMPLIAILVVSVVVGTDGLLAVAAVSLILIMIGACALVLINLMGAIGVFAVVVQSNQVLPRPPPFDWRMTLASVLLFGGFLTQWIQSLS